MITRPEEGDVVSAAGVLVTAMEVAAAGAAGRKEVFSRWLENLLPEPSLDAIATEAGAIAELPR